MTREEAKHIDAFKYWCETNEENGVITVPKFLCEHIIEILDDNKEERPHGEWKVIHNALGETKYKCSQCQHYVRSGDDKNFCPNCGADMRGGDSDA